MKKNPKGTSKEYDLSGVSGSCARESRPQEGVLASDIGISPLPSLLEIVAGWRPPLYAVVSLVRNRTLPGEHLNPRLLCALRILVVAFVLYLCPINPLLKLILLCVLHIHFACPPSKDPLANRLWAQAPLGGTELSVCVLTVN